MTNKDKVIMMISNQKCSERNKVKIYIKSKNKENREVEVKNIIKIKTELQFE